MKGKDILSWLAAGVCLAGAVVWWGVRDRRPVLVCLGDSLTSCGGAGGHFSHWLAAFLPQVRVIDAGVGGDTLEGGRARFARDVLKHRPDVVLIALGANDFWRRSRLIDDLREDLTSMVRDARARQCQVVVASCFGDRDFWEETCVEFGFGRFECAWEIAQMEREVCESFGCPYVPNMQIDVKPNRLPPYWDLTDHPNKAGNEQVALRLMPALRQALAQAVR
jgi:lysophospholipase L1-like esterase